MIQVIIFVVISTEVLVGLEGETEVDSYVK